MLSDFTLLYLISERSPVTSAIATSAADFFCAFSHVDCCWLILEKVAALFVSVTVEYLCNLSDPGRYPKKTIPDHSKIAVHWLVVSDEKQSLASKTRKN